MLEDNEHVIKILPLHHRSQLIHLLNDSVYFSRDVKDRCVLKIYEPDQPLLPPAPQNGISRSPSMSPKIGHAPRCNYNSGHESDTSVRSAPTLTAPQSPGHHRAFNTEVSILYGNKAKWVQDCSNSSALALELLQSCTKLSKWFSWFMIMSWHGIDFRITDPVWGYSIGHWWIPSQKTSNV